MVQYVQRRGRGRVTTAADRATATVAGRRRQRLDEFVAKLRPDQTVDDDVTYLLTELTHLLTYLLTCLLAYGYSICRIRIPIK